LNSNRYALQACSIVVYQPWSGHFHANLTDYIDPFSRAHIVAAPDSHWSKESKIMYYSRQLAKYISIHRICIFSGFVEWYTLGSHEDIIGARTILVSLSLALAYKIIFWKCLKKDDGSSW